MCIPSNEFLGSDTLAYSLPELSAKQVEALLHEIKSPNLAYVNIGNIDHSSPMRSFSFLERNLKNCTSILSTVGTAH